MAPQPLSLAVTRTKHDKTPEHHIVAKPPSWTTALSAWTAPAKRERSRSRSRERSVSGTGKIVGFVNPWPSFHKPTRQELWNSLAFGVDDDPCIELAASHVPTTPKANSKRATRDEQAAHLLRIEKPDFSFDGNTHRAKSTWLGHACMLLQLPSLDDQGSPVRILFDPIFSMRCSPSQAVGPIRSYVPPCKLEDLPPIHIVLISHNHYDHLDYDTIRSLWKLHRSTIRFIVPLKNKKWFTDCGIDADRVEELDWWDAVTVTAAAGSSSSADDAQLRITCTPAQHGSGRESSDANMALWSSWYLEHRAAARSSDPYRIFFAGDTGYQFHGDPAWPPQPPSPSPSSPPSKPKPAAKSSYPTYPPCPAFTQITTRLSPPHLLFLPLALGATWAYLKSFTSNYLPLSLDPFPRHSAGVTGSIHMPPWDAVRVLREMTAGEEAAGGAGDGGGAGDKMEYPVAIGMHWGTFVTDKTEVLKTLGQLEWACGEQGVDFRRGLREKEEGGERERPCFLALNHGQSVVT